MTAQEHIAGAGGTHDVSPEPSVIDADQAEAWRASSGG